ncbi:hypothetical protein SOASR030_08010 [Leminorella grimontii]|uniref:Uncharacterized protein n=1 Tax=Leminorella grimontii TaxID=82981 RepID=A0AAV5N0X3_9GAMM|nr:hypothetical protein SOASR030_08010 [Leminorella grimontii]
MIKALYRGRCNRVRRYHTRRRPPNEDKCHKKLTDLTLKRRQNETSYLKITYLMNFKTMFYR